MQSEMLQMLKSDQCRQNAEYYFQLAEQTLPKKQKCQLSRLALEWLRLTELTRRQEILTRNSQGTPTELAA